MPSPLLGYNNNVRHHGKVFHIQTEDSGVQHAHIFTHLFADGGRIIATKKTSYQKHLGSDRFAEVVKKLMQAQHKAMFIALRDGLFDDDELAGAREFAAREIVVEDETPRAAEGPSAPVDVDALERAAAGYDGGNFADRVPEEPARAAGITSVGLDSSPGIAPATPRRTSSSATFPRPDAAAASPPSSRTSGRYGVTAPVAPRAAAPAPVKEPSKPRTESLFGQDLLSDKSLDEVILSYLADELDEKK
ncbi:MAG: hypothetical protein U0234_21780 [Sandaracinus sp.]